MVIRVADALQAIHDEGIIHRDLKTPNIMVDSKSVVRLMDFGIAKQEQGDGLSMTVTGQIIGTPEYMSPEQVQAQHLDSRSDVYSLGIVVFEVFTGATPFRADTPLGTVLKHLNEPPPLEGPQATLLPAAVVPCCARRSRSAGGPLRQRARDGAGARGGACRDAQPDRQGRANGSGGDDPRGRRDAGADARPGDHRRAARGRRGYHAAFTTAPVAASVVGLDRRRVWRRPWCSPRQSRGFRVGRLRPRPWLLARSPSRRSRSRRLRSLPRRSLPPRPPVLLRRAPPRLPGAARADPKIPAAEAALGRGDPDLAPRDVDAAAQADAALERLLTEGERALEAQSFDTAIARYDEALKLDPRNALARMGRTTAVSARVARAPAVPVPAKASFVAERTVAESVETRPDSSLASAFEESPGIPVTRDTQPALLPGRIEFKTEPATVGPGEQYKLEVRFVNTGAAPIEIKDMLVTTTVNERKSGGPVPPSVSTVAPGQGAAVLSVSDTLREDLRSWSIEIVLRTSRGEGYRNRLVWTAAAAPDAVR